MKRTEIHAGKRTALPTEMVERMKALDRENRKFRLANEILRKASACSAEGELDRLFKR